MRYRKHLTVGGALCVLLCASPSPVDAQGVATSFEQLGVLVAPGDRITVVDAAGTKSDGRIGTLSRDRLMLMTPAGPRALAEADIAEIRQRRGDSLKNGAIAGAVAGAAYYVTMAAIFSAIEEGDVLVGPAVAGGVLFAGLGAAAGAGIDALITHRQVIYRRAGRDTRISVAPLLGGGRRGAALRVRF